MKLLQRAVRSRSLGADEGFSLVETLVALGIAVVAILSLLGTSIFALRSSVEGRQNQLAGDLLNAAFEEVRSLNYAAVALTTADVTATTDADVVKTATPFTYDPGEGPAEPIAMQATGGSSHLNPYVQQKSTPSGPYTVRRYITVPAGTPTVRGLPAVKRLTVTVSWRHYGKTHVRRAGTLITNTRRGLPLPSYSWTYNGPAPLVGTEPTWAKNPGSSVDFGFILINKGARDNWALTTNPAVPGWSWYRDTNQNGLFEAGEPSLGSSSFETGFIEAGAAPFYVVAHRDIPVTESGSGDVTFTAGSVSQPTYPTKSVTGSLTVAGGAVTPAPNPSATPTATATPSSATCNPGIDTGLAAGGTRPNATTHANYTVSDLFLFNGPPDGDTTTLASNTMSTQSSTLQGSACNFSTDQQTNQAGRLLSIGGAGTTGRAEWRFQPASAAQDGFKGTAVLSVWVQCTGAAPTLTASLGRYSETDLTFTQQASGSVTASGCPAAANQFHRVDIQLPLQGNGATVAAGTAERLSLRLTTTQQVRLLYGTTAAQARLTVAMG